MNSIRILARLARWCWLGLLLGLASCSPEEHAIDVDLSRREPIRLRSEVDAITYAYLPQYSHTVSYKRHHRLVEYLRRETGLNIHQVFPETFDQHMKMVGRGEIDISFSNPFIYTKLAQRCGATAFARIVESGDQDSFRGQIICRMDHPSIRMLADCRGKRWIAVDPTSAGGYLYPLGHFIENGLRKEDFAEIAFAPGSGGKQEKVVLSVFAGKHDVGTIREGTLNVVADKVDIAGIRVIASTRWYPGWVYSATADLEPDKVAAIGSALLRLDIDDPQHRTILDAAQFTRIIQSDDDDFDPIRELAEKVGISLSE
jgi:phosphonate transport system substrate-binding protein